ncbi:hypothetical protein [Agrococcus sp. ARC_14]|uniref:hypothetical protein n=1 Tax=Agrococcus sp. ARC_14 TaxID=2919927 RepID=UPI001F070DB5|nr:hypothetical protein [Agrococcus sp. ARC_14]MCH1884195.1 hypothetical protein [Agrococcus sp. ARC_14]
MSGSFRLPVVGVSVALAPAGVRLLAAMTLLAGAGTIAGIAQGPVLAAREPFVTPIVLALGVLTVLATVLPLLDGGYRPLLVGIPVLALSLVAAVSLALGAAWPTPLLASLLIVLGGCTIVYHLLGRGLSDQGE